MGSERGGGGEITSAPMGQGEGNGLEGEGGSALIEYRTSLERGKG